LKTVIEAAVDRLDLRRGGGIDPRLRHHLSSIPTATIEHQLTNLRHVTRPHPEAAPILWVAVREPCPRDIGDTQGIEQQCGGKHIEAVARRPAKDPAKLNDRIGVDLSRSPTTLQLPAPGTSRNCYCREPFNLSDSAVEEALYDSSAMRRFVGIDLSREPAPDETTVCRFRHLLEAHDLGQQLFDEVQRHLASKGLNLIGRTSR
jgi:hypothetical protein